jgi:acyl carrier protein
MIVAALHKTANVFNDPTILTRLNSLDDDPSLEDMGLDSLDLAEWALALEDGTGLVVNPAELAGAINLSDVEQIIAAKLNAQGR